MAIVASFVAAGNTVISEVTSVETIPTVPSDSNCRGGGGCIPLYSTRSTLEPGEPLKQVDVNADLPGGQSN